MSLRTEKLIAAIIVAAILLGVICLMANAERLLMWLLKDISEHATTAYWQHAAPL